MKKFDWKSYLHFSKQERRLIWGIIIVIAGATAASIFWKPKGETSATRRFEQFFTDSAANIASWETKYNSRADSSRDIAETGSLFAFDPNTLDENGWRKLGLPERNIRTIINYRNKGGKFRQPEDIKKIYGVSEAAAEKLIPYVRIEGSGHPYFSGGYQQNYSSNYTNNYAKKTPKPIDINTATEDDWKSLPGIGDVLSKRIVKYRNVKGGFKNIDEVAKTYGISDSEFAVIRPYLTMSENVSPAAAPQTPAAQAVPQPKININTATEAEMRASRAIPYSVIKVIIIYREQHGGFKSVEELKKIPFVTDEMYNKMSPKLTAE